MRNKKENLKEYEVYKRGYKYLNDKHSFEIYNFIKNYILDNKLLDKLKKNDFTLDDFIEQDFYYYDVFVNFLSGNYYVPGNIYYEVDKNFKNNFNSLSLRNTMHDQLKKLYNEFKIKNIIEDKLYKILLDSADEYENIYEFYGERFTKSLIKKCKFITISNKYNI